MPLEAALDEPAQLARRPRRSVIRIGPQRCCGETLSYSSSTDFSHGCGSSPSDVFSTSSVRPPEVEKKYVATGVPS